MLIDKFLFSASNQLVTSLKVTFLNHFQQLGTKLYLQQFIHNIYNCIFSLSAIQTLPTFFIHYACELKTMHVKFFKIETFSGLKYLLFASFRLPDCSLQRADYNEY